MTCLMRMETHSLSCGMKGLKLCLLPPLQSLSQGSLLSLPPQPRQYFPPSEIMGSTDLGCDWHHGFYNLLELFFKDFTYLFLDRRERKEKEGERNINVGLPLTRSLLGTWPATQACALTGNRTCNPLVHMPHSIH